ncbi:MAG: HAD-IIIA family hydrolase [Patescibacteria group bacterium]
MNTAVIIAGGKGTRMGVLGTETPKALLPIVGKPLLAYQLALLKTYGFKRVLIVTNHLGAQIEKFCGTSSQFGLSIHCLRENKPLGTAGALKSVEEYLLSDFLVLYGDEMIHMDLARLLAFHRHNKTTLKRLLGTLAVHPNDHPADSNLVEIDRDNFITSFLTKPHPQDLWFHNLVSTPVYVFTPEIFNYIPEGVYADFGRDIFPRIACKQKNLLAAYTTPEYIKDIGTPERLREVRKDVRSGVFARMSLKYKRPAVFLDRDGVINEEVGNLNNIEDFTLLPRVAKAIKRINESGYYAVVISNQPVVAKGFCTYDDVVRIHKKMETLLGREGAKLDAVYFCPHHPDKGFQGENKEYKMVCRCRKPKTGMIETAARDLNIDMRRSVLIGDRTSDAKTAENAGVRFFGVKTGSALHDGVFTLRQRPRRYKDLFAIVNRRVFML